MRLNLGALQRVVKTTIDESKAVESLKEEISRVFGPAVIVEGNIESIATSANDWLDVLDRTGRSNRINFKPSTTVNFLNYNHPEVRKFAVRIVPEKFLSKMVNDKNPEVRAAVAARVPLNTIKEMIKRFPSDDQLRSIFRTRKLHEAGLTAPKVQPLGHDPVEDKKRLGDTVRTQEGPELDESWYNSVAQEFLYQYGRNIEYSWEEKAVNRFCSSVKASYNTEIDESKLLKSIKDLIKDKEDKALKRDALKETLDWLTNQSEQEEILFEMSDGSKDSVEKLVESNLTPEQYLQSISNLFCVQESMLPIGIRKYRLGEGNARQVLVPCVGTLPHAKGLRSIDECALDTFCEYWSRKQALAGEPLRLEWSNHPEDVNKISFSCSLK